MAPIEIVEHEGHRIVLATCQHDEDAPEEAHLKGWSKSEGYVLLSMNREGKARYGLFRPEEGEDCFMFKPSGRGLKWNGLPPQWVLSLVHKLLGLPAIE